MSITVDCPACGHSLKAPDNAAGRKGLYSHKFRCESLVGVA